MSSKTLSIKLPIINFNLAGNTTLLKDKFFSLAQNLKNRASGYLADERVSQLRSRFPKKAGVIAAIVLLSIAALVGLVNLAKRSASTSAQVAIAGPKTSLNLNKEYNFPLSDSSGKEISKFKYVIESIDLRDEIVVKGQKATAVKGKSFMVINLKIVNEHNQGVQINTKDYVRLSVNGNKDEWLAPDIHNDPVEVQAISTKLTRVGYAVNNTDKDLVLRIGEINGEKTELPINFK